MTDAPPLAIDRAAVERPHERTLWGQKHQVRPKFVAGALGDAQKLLIVTPINTRPNYYVIRIDSTWQDSNFTEEGECVCDHIDEIYAAIEAEYGSSYEDNDDGVACHREWPALSADSGCSWSELDPAEYRTPEAPR